MDEKRGVSEEKDVKVENVINQGAELVKKEEEGEEGEEKEEYFQNIFLQLSDGNRIKASIPAFCFSEEEAEKVRIVGIGISPPMKLPKDVTFGKPFEK